MTKPALYYHFGSKEGMLLAILEEGAREFEAAVERAVQRPGHAPATGVLALAEDLYGLFAKNVPVVRVSHSVFHGPAKTRPTFDFTRFDRSLVGGLKQIVEAGQAAGETAPGPARGRGDGGVRRDRRLGCEAASPRAGTRRRRHPASRD